ncbi:MAG: ABC transporter permease [Chloroflexi bacterium]|nr:ABC transporter permease [Chloroflexota bacterium]
MVPVLLVIYTMVFFLMRIMPGGPWDNADRPLPEAVLANLRAKYHADDPLWQQYTDYLVGVTTRFDFGPSYRNAARSVSDIFRDFVPVSLQLGVAAMVLALAVGVPLGVLAAARRNTWLDHVAMFVALAGISIPNYVMASLLVLALASWLGLVPTSGWDGLFSKQAIVPLLALAVGPAAALARYARASALEVIGQDYIRTARAKGFGEVAVMARHLLKNALIPVATVAGVQLAAIGTGSFFVETVCGVPGIGRYFVVSVTGRDYPMIMGTVLLMALAISLLNLLVDVSYALLDPRVRLE